MTGPPIQRTSAAAQRASHFAVKDGSLDQAVRYLVVVAATVLFAALGFMGFLFGLDAVGRKPPPGAAVGAK